MGKLCPKTPSGYLTQKSENPICTVSFPMVHTLDTFFMYVLNVFFFPFFIVVLGGGTCGIYESSYRISKILYLNSPLPPFSIILPHPIPGILSTGLICPFTYMCTQYLHHIYIPILFPHLLPLPLVPKPPDRTCSFLLFYDFVKEKKMILLFI
jgi:hypothetical protein